MNLQSVFFRWSAISKNNFAVGRRIAVFNSALRFEYDSIVLCAFAYQGRWTLNWKKLHIAGVSGFLIREENNRKAAIYCQCQTSGLKLQSFIITVNFIIWIDFQSTKWPKYATISSFQRCQALGKDFVLTRLGVKFEQWGETCCIAHHCLFKRDGSFYV